MTADGGQAPEEQEGEAAQGAKKQEQGAKKQEQGAKKQEQGAKKQEQGAKKKGQDRIALEVCGHELYVSNPGKVFFPERSITKLDLVNYYIECAPAVVRHLRERPTVMKRWVDGVQGEPFFQKRVPSSAPEWIETATVTFPSGRSARELVPNDAAHLVWGVNLGVIDWNPWPVRRADLDHPDELRIDLDPGPEVPFSEVRQVALGVREVLAEHGLRGHPKTSGSRGMHVYVRIRPEHGFTEVRRAALALARAVERNMPGRATSRWWKEEREGVFIDYNQNARDRTVASAYSVRAVPDARVSCPLQWEEVADVDPAELRLDTVPARLRERGDPSATIDDAPASLAPLLELAARDEREGLGDAPWPPHFRKQKNEPRRVQPSRAKRVGKEA
jgi:DNA ligase D